MASAQDIHQTSTSKTTGTTRTAGVSYGTSYGGDTGANVKVGLNVSKGTETTKTNTVTDTVQKGTQLTSGKNITITSGNDTTLVNTDVKASGQTNINAGGDVNLLAAADTHEVTNTTSTTKTSSVGVTAGVSANVANDGLSTDGSFTTGALNTGLTQTKSKTTTTSTTTTTTTEKGTTIRSDGGTVVVAANNVNVENTTTTGDVLTAGDTVTAGGAVNETTLEDTSKTVTTTTSTSSTSTKFSGPDIKQAALDTVANAMGEVGANKIGDLKADGLDTVTHKALHAANGAVQGAIKSGGDLDGAAAGAIGAAVGEIVAEVVDDGTATRTNEKGQQVTKVASIAAQIAAGLAGKDTDIAAGAATNAVENNRMLHTKEILALKKLAPEYAEKEGISEEEAFQKLISQALRDVDDVYYDSHAQWDKSAQEYLLKNATGTVEIAGRNVLMFTSGGADFKANATLLSETWSQYKDEYLQSVQTPIYTADEKFKTQKQVLDAYLTTISMMPGGAIVEMTTRYEQAVREGDAKTVAEIEQSIPLEVLTAIIPSALKKAGEAVVAGGKKLFKGGEKVAGNTPSINYPKLARPADTTPANIILGDLDELGRPTGVTSIIKTSSLGTGSSAKSSIKPPEFGGKDANHARGHLLANMLGGAGDDARNLVTLFQRNANHPNMSSFERQVRKVVENGETINFRAIPIYDGNKGMPIGVTLTARGSRGFNLDVSIPNVSAVK